MLDHSRFPAKPKYGIGDIEMVVCVTMSHGNIIDDALEILGDYTLGLDKYIPIRAALRSHGESVLVPLDDMIIKHLSIATFSSGAWERPRGADLIVRKCYDLDTSVLLTALCLHAWCLSQHAERPYPIAWTRFVELVETYEEEKVR